MNTAAIAKDRLRYIVTQDRAWVRRRFLVENLHMANGHILRENGVICPHNPYSLASLQMSYEGHAECTHCGERAHWN